MKLPLGITLTLSLLLILRNFQQVSTQIPDEWKRSNETLNEEVLGTDIPPEDEESYSGGEPLNPSATKGPSLNDTENVNFDGSIATTISPFMPFNSSSELSDILGEVNETQAEGSVANTPTPEQDETALNNTYTTPKPETTTTQSSPDEQGSGDVPSDTEPTNSTTKSPTTTTTEGSVKDKTTVKPTEPPVYKTTTPKIPPVIPEDITTAAPVSDETQENPAGHVDTRGGSEKGFSSDEKEEKKGQAWAIVLAVGIIVGIIALAAFVILNRRNRRDFYHRKLEEDMAPDPVLRLDNSEPLDLKFDGFGYYNPGLQGDNIQMTNFPQGRPN